MNNEHLIVEQSLHLSGEVEVSGAKNAVLVAIASLILADGISTLYNVPDSADVRLMISLMQSLGCVVAFDQQRKELTVDTSTIGSYSVSPDIMNKMRASILVMGPLLARFGKSKVALPGGCLIGARPIDYHLKGFAAMGVVVKQELPYLHATLESQSDLHHRSTRIVFEYPSVGATENIMMLAALYDGETIIVNAAIEPEVIDLIDILTAMGAKITCQPGSNILIRGVKTLRPIEHHMIPDRLEAGVLLLAGCVSGGTVSIPNARADHLDMFLYKLKESGHHIDVGTHATIQNPLQGIIITAAEQPKALSIKTGVYPSFPTDLQAPTMTSLCIANGTSIVEETVFENRLVHTRELQKMGAQVTVSGNTATICGVEFLYGTHVIATDIRASSSLVLAGLVAEGVTTIANVHHWKRGYDRLEMKLQKLGAHVRLAASDKKQAVFME